MFSEDRYSLDEHMTYAIQFIELNIEQLDSSALQNEIPDRILSYITEFDESLTEEEFNNPQFAYRLLFTRKLVNRPGQADKVIEFIDPNSELAKKIDHEYWVKKEVEKPKFRPSDVARVVQEHGFPKFRTQPEHVDMWKKEDAKNPSKNYGVFIQGSWYWYQRWVDRCLELCDIAGDYYR